MEQIKEQASGCSSFVAAAATLAPKFLQMCLSERATHMTFFQTDEVTERNKHPNVRRDPLFPAIAQGWADFFTGGSQQVLQIPKGFSVLPKKRGVSEKGATPEQDRNWKKLPHTAQLSSFHFFYYCCDMSVRRPSSGITYGIWLAYINMYIPDTGVKYMQGANQRAWRLNIVDGSHLKRQCYTKP